jgi:hypothetical protein
MARVAAAKTLLQVNDEQSQRLGGAAQALPGFVIVINAPTAHAPRTVGDTMGTIDGTANKPMISDDERG